LTYTPNNIQAAVGDMVQFQFGPVNHTVTQSSFDEPCVPLSESSNQTGIFSGFQPVSADATTIPTYTIQINNTTPVWIYCSQAMHCQKGMVMVINENTTKNATRSLANFVKLASEAAKNIAPNASPSNGTEGSTSSSGSATPSGSGTSSGSSSSSSSSSSASSQSHSAGVASFKISGILGMGALMAAGITLFL